MATRTRPTLLRPHLCGYRCEVLYTLDDDETDARGRDESMEILEVRQHCPRHVGFDATALRAAILDETVRFHAAVDVLEAWLPTMTRVEIGGALGMNKAGRFTLDLPGQPGAYRAQLEAMIP